MGNSLVIQWLGFHASTAGDTGSIPGWGTKILHATWLGQNKQTNTTAKCLKTGTSLVAQWLGIRLPMQGTQVRALVWEDPTCHGATKPMRYNYRACALEPTSHNY